MAEIPVQAEFARKWLGSKWQENFPMHEKETLKSFVVIQTAVN